jgi:hypothetical protein
VLYARGVRVTSKLVAAAGVSNFNLQDMQELLGWARVRPAVLETRSDPLAASTPLLNFCLERNITFISYSSLGSQWGSQWGGANPVLSHPVLKVSVATVPGTAHSTKEGMSYEWRYPGTIDGGMGGPLLQQCSARVLVEHALLGACQDHI